MRATIRHGGEVNRPWFGNGRKRLHEKSRTCERPQVRFRLLAVLGAAIMVGFVLRDGGGAFGANDLSMMAGALGALIGHGYSGKLSRELPGWEVISWILVISLPVTLPARFWLMPRGARGEGFINSGSLGDQLHDGSASKITHPNAHLRSPERLAEESSPLGCGGQRRPPLGNRRRDYRTRDERRW